MSLSEYRNPDLPPESLNLDSDPEPDVPENSPRLELSARVILIILVLLALSLLAGLLGSPVLSQLTQLVP